jgi:hypothetical protein
MVFTWLVVLDTTLRWLAYRVRRLLAGEPTNTKFLINWWPWFYTGVVSTNNAGFVWQACANLEHPRSEWSNTAVGIP